MIKKASLQYLDAIHALINSAAKSSQLLPRSKVEIKKVIKNFYIYEVNNTVAGCCALEIYNKKLAEIRSLVVKPEYRKQGIGFKLISACKKEAKRKHVYEILVITDRVSLFEKLGFANCLNNQTALFFKP